MFAALSRLWRRRRVTVLQPFGAAADPAALRVTVCDSKPAVADALHKAFHGVAAVEVVLGSLFDVGADALVSPANSFGDMSGGLDQQIDRARTAALAHRQRIEQMDDLMLDPADRTTLLGLWEEVVRGADGARAALVQMRESLSGIQQKLLRRRNAIAENVLAGRPEEARRALDAWVAELDEAAQHLHRLLDTAAATS